MEESQLKNPTTWLRISYRVGAIADGIVALAMFAEAILGRPSPLTHYAPGTPYRYAIGLGASLMLGWTLLLLWADRKPEERRGVLLLTIVVVLGLMGSGLFAMSTGFMPNATGMPVLVFQGLLIVLFISSYIASVRQRPGTR
jgi:hypothetical protein